MLRVVLDTNIIVSGIISPKGYPRKIMDCCRKGEFILLTSEIINREIIEVLHREKIYRKYNLCGEIIEDIKLLLYN